MEFVVNVPEVPADGVLGEAKTGGYLFIGMAFGKEFEDIAFAGGEAFDFGGGGDRFLEGGDDFTGDFAGHGRTALANLADGGNEFFRRAAFQEVTAGAGTEGFKDTVGVFINGDHDDLGRRKELFEPGGAFDAGNVRELDVHEDNIGLLAGDLLEGFLGGGAKAYAFTFWGGVEEVFEALADEAIVFDDGDFGHGGVDTNFTNLH
jgi:hypothetical protein